MSVLTLMDASKLKLRKLTVEDVAITIRCEEEQTDPREHFSSEDENHIEDEAMFQDIEKRLTKGDQWAWCCAIVEVKWGTFKNEGYLGCCSYDNEEDFRKDGYFDDMVLENLEQLNEGLSKIFGELLPLVEIDTSTT